ncbi:MAG TPA: hypothetical protein VFL91_11025 [Thermomicrobiales bacterium]|nr:hypothetical protein [Thermomicrobiales bacterium]
MRDADRRPEDVAADDVWIIMPQYGKDVVARFDQVRREVGLGQPAFTG